MSPAGNSLLSRDNIPLQSLSASPHQQQQLLVGSETAHVTTGAVSEPTTEPTAERKEPNTEPNTEHKEPNTISICLYKYFQELKHKF